MVGDTRIDIREGRQAGAQTVAVGWGYQSEETLRKEQPDYFVRQPGDLPRTVELLEELPACRIK